MAVFVLVLRISFLHSTYPVEAQDLSDAKYQRDRGPPDRGGEEEEEEVEKKGAREEERESNRGCWGLNLRRGPR